MTECIACGEDKSDKVDMLAGIEKALEYEGDWTRLEDGMLECGLRDQFDGEQTGPARIIVDDGMDWQRCVGRFLRGRVPVR